MFEDAATVVAVGAAFVAALSALYVRWQAMAAGRANEISLHENRLAVYKGLARFRVHITAVGVGLKEEEVWRFAEIAELSEFYFPPKIHPRMNGVFEQALKLMSLNDEWNEAKQSDPGKVRTLVTERHELMRGIRDECYTITDELKRRLHVGEA